MELKFGFLFTVLNSGDYLWHSLVNAYQLCIQYPGSKIVIVEGADRFVDRSIVTPEGSSRDDTSSVIRDFPDPLGILQYTLVGNVEDRSILRQKGLTHLEDMDYVVLKSYRELFHCNVFRRIGEEIQRKSPYSVTLRSATLHNSFGWRWKTCSKKGRQVIFRNTGEIPITPALDKSLLLDVELWSYNQIGTALSLFKRYIYGVNRVNYKHRAELFYHHKTIPEFEEYKRDWLEAQRETDLDKEVKVELKEHPEAIRTHPWAILTPWQIFNWSIKLPTFMGDNTCLKDIC